LKNPKYINKSDKYIVYQKIPKQVGEEPEILFPQIFQNIPKQGGKGPNFRSPKLKKFTKRATTPFLDSGENSKIM
jgi:hypothetical protein